MRPVLAGRGADSPEYARSRLRAQRLAEEVGRIREAILALTPLVSNQTLQAVLEGAWALERGESRGAGLIQRHAGELRRLLGHQCDAVQTLLAVAVERKRLGPKLGGAER